MKRHTTTLSAAQALTSAVEAVAQVSAARAQELVRAGAVYVNGRRAHAVDAQVGAGAVVTVMEGAGGEVSAPHRAAPALEVLFEDDEVLVVNKPPGVLAQPAPKGRGASLLELASAHLGHDAGLVHRLDADTSGVTVFGKTREATARLSEVFREGRAQKRYLAVTGPGLPAQGTVDLPLSRDPKHPRRWRAKQGVEGVEARTDFVRLADGEVCLVALHPRTGRTHQLRAHLAALGCPIVGDRLYGGAKGPRCLLHAQALHVDGVTWEAPVPEDLLAYFRAAGVTPPSGW